MEQSTTRKPFPIKKILGISSVVVIIGVTVWLSPIMITTVQNYGYTRVDIKNLTAATVKLGDKTYIFEYYPPEFAIIPLGVIHNAVQGATYRDSGLETKVSEVHSDYIVLLVKPL